MDEWPGLSSSNDVTACVDVEHNNPENFDRWLREVGVARRDLPSSYHVFSTSESRYTRHQRNVYFFWMSSVYRGSVHKPK